MSEHKTAMNAENGIDLDEPDNKFPNGAQYDHLSGLAEE